MKAEGQAKWTGTYKERQAQRGLKQIQIWIPESEETSIRRYIERKRKNFLKNSS